MSIINTNPQESVRLAAHSAGPIAPPATALPDWFLESADFLPDWLTTKAPKAGTSKEGANNRQPIPVRPQLATPTLAGSINSAAEQRPSLQAHSIPAGLSLVTETYSLPAPLPLPARQQESYRQRTERVWSSEELQRVSVRVFDRFTQILFVLTMVLGILTFVVFPSDFNQGISDVLYDIHPLLVQMANSGAALVSGAIMGGAALLSALWLLWRSILLWRYRSWLDAGCPRCHKHELMRVERYMTDRLLQTLGLPAYRYHCRHCTWQGIRLSIGGLSASPRSRLVRVR
jgi:hypothetical protein